MAKESYYYIAPQIFPVFPEASGVTIVGIDILTLLKDAASELSDIDLDFSIELIMSGEKQSEESLTLEVRDGRVSPDFIYRTFTLAEVGYVVISLNAETPYFRKLKPEFGYGMLVRPDGGFTTIISQAKYAVPLIIDNMRQTGTFCLVHPAHYIDRTRNSGNSVILVNPYEGMILARLLTAGGKELKQRLPSRSAALVSLEPLLTDGRSECIMYTGNNRLIGWDIRHTSDDSSNIYNIDHLEYFRAYSTLEPRSIAGHVRKAVRRGLRATGLWF